MKKNLFTILGIIFIIIIIISLKIYNDYQKKIKIHKANSEYEYFLNKEIIGSDLASLINRIEDSNNKNNITKDENGNYINNDKNSIRLDVKFLELEDVIPSERIRQKGINQFVQNFNIFTFKCIKIEYHKDTGHVKYMYFEQI